MSQTKLVLFASSLAAALVLAFSAPAGTSAPSLIRQVHLNGVSGPAYYSIVEGGYRPIRLPSALVETKVEQVAEMHETAPAN